MILQRRKLESGEIDLADTPKGVWESEPTSRMHELDNFRAQYNRMKKNYAVPESEFF